MKPLPDLSDLYDRLGIPQAGRDLIEYVRHSEPARRVSDGRSNVCGAIPVDKMGVGIQYESRTNERRLILRWMFDPSVIEFWDQPTGLTIHYHNQAGRKVSSVHIPDFLRIAETGIDFVECKTPDDLVSLNFKYPDRFLKNEAGRWVSPAGIDSCAAYGIGYEVSLPTDVPAVFVRNADFLLDYFRDSPDPGMLRVIDDVVGIVEEHKAMSLCKLIKKVRSPDAVYFAIASQKIHFRMDDELLCYPDASYVFCSPVYSEAMRFMLASAIPTTSAPLNLEIGVTLLWDGNPWRVVNFGDAVYSVTNDGGQMARLRADQIAALVRDGHMRSLAPEENAVKEAWELLLTASPRDLQEGVRKAKILNQVAGGFHAGLEVKPRTIRQWREDARDAEQRYGNAFLGLIGRVSRRGRWGSHLNPIMDNDLSRSINEDFLTASPRSKIAAHRLYQAHCEQAGRPYASYETYRLRIESVELTTRTERRHGRKAAYQVRGPLLRASSHNETLPPHGDRAFELAHADHTELPINLASAITGQVLGRPWLSLLIDAFTRIVLAYFLTFEPPSYRALMMLTRECARRYGRLPQKCITDWGKEFGSIYFETLLTSHYVERMHREAGEPRYGAPIERINGSSQTQFVNTLMGNTLNLRNPRSLSSTHNPERLAVWTPAAFDDRLGEWLYDIYPNLPHMGINERPAERMARSMQQVGLRPIRLFAYDQNFLRETLPAPTPESRPVRRGTIRLNHVDYKGESLESSTVWGQKVPVRYDPYDISYIYVFVNRRWERLYTDNQMILEYSERNQIRFAHMEVYARCRNAGRDYRHGPEQVLQFMLDVQNQERHLLALRNYNLDRSTHDPRPEAVPRISNSEVAAESVPMSRRAFKERL